MNCLEFRRHLMQAPFASNDELAEHEASCPTCAAFAEDLRTQEMQIRAIMNNVAPPPELAAKIQFAVRLEQRKSRRHQAWYAMAASVLLFVGVSMVSLVNESWERGNLALASSMVDHIQDEYSHLHEHGPAPVGRVKFVFSRFGAKLNEDIGQVNFAAECFMRKRNGVHLVVPGKIGPVTVFYMPSEHIATSATITVGDYQGEIYPTEWGSVAVLGEPNEPLEGFAQTMANKVSWPATQQISQRPSFKAQQIAQN